MLRKILKTTLTVLHKDGEIDCNEYQGKDFDKLEKEICKTCTATNKCNLDLNYNPGCWTPKDHKDVKPKATPEQHKEFVKGVTEHMREE